MCICSLCYIQSPLVPAGATSQHFVFILSDFTSGPLKCLGAVTSLLGYNWMSYTYFISLNSDFEGVELPNPKANVPHAQAVITCRGDSGHEDCIGMQGVTPQIFLLPPDWIQNCLNVGKQEKKTLRILGCWVLRTHFCLLPCDCVGLRQAEFWSVCFLSWRNWSCTTSRKHVLSCC